MTNKPTTSMERMMCKASGPCDCENCERLRREDATRVIGAKVKASGGGRKRSTTSLRLPCIVDPGDWVTLDRSIPGRMAITVASWADDKSISCIVLDDAGIGQLAAFLATARP